MSDLNLMPQEFKIQREERTRKAVYIILAVVVIFMLLICACIPLYLIRNVNKQNAAVEQDIKALEYVTAEVARLNKEKSGYQDKINILDSFNKQEIKWTIVVNDLSALIPSDVTIDSISYGKDVITLQGTSFNQQAIAVFVANVENSDKFLFDKIGSITPDEKGKSFKFNISFMLSNDEGKVK